MPENPKITKQGKIQKIKNLEDQTSPQKPTPEKMASRSKNQKNQISANQ